ncbi:hypothetical protein LEMLEM_LOCUS4682, partial [Lemmus lemmus]
LGVCILRRSWSGSEPVCWGSERECPTRSRSRERTQPQDTSGSGLKQ